MPIHMLGALQGGVSMVPACADLGWCCLWALPLFGGGRALQPQPCDSSCGMGELACELRRGSSSLDRARSNLVSAVRQAEMWTRLGRQVLQAEQGSPAKEVKRRGAGKGAKGDALETPEDIAEARPLRRLSAVRCSARILTHYRIQACAVSSHARVAAHTRQGYAVTAE